MKEDIDFIARQLDLHLAQMHPVLFQSVAEGVPADMRDGDINEDGWVRWKCIPSFITAEESRNWRRNSLSLFRP
ncbi:hypothetical protein WJ0W_003152 [Paenibacillus melissococcoides]|uniref:Uncharacterized protein n=1 Tax=Paenibacillus melissococcoides TaxID=2912268 RepID=A0ABN8U877_9BACL|nr:MULTISPECIES: hypothetical protein [Paenibacillus]MEB9892264.1 hypothetical protein [Bacillus cereus]CAH8245917.1 hypothetical protein WJ0W_003152 [Paenibacillus melissococcoides]CAH8712459.1 hypothetical protein WDD9_003235 [Paenibacillus melissococcoides]CAH8713205.1 hypothetical protein HTL2_003538 [Paenibacillus melissococcoides]GIO77542.1 hypothetical protein J6TS7_11520 [Paenibacillus dendritiformis]